MSEWSILLRGGEAEQALDAIGRIGDDLVSVPDGDLVNLARGDAGIGLALCMLGQWLGRPAWSDSAEIRLGNALESAVQDASGIGLWTGLSGTVWAVELATSILEPDDDEDQDGDDEDGFDQIDSLLQSVVTASRDKVHFELFTGLAGVGVYALQRLHRPGARRLLELVTEQLCDRAASSAEGHYWFSSPDLLGPDRKLFPDGYHSLGPAHGTPAVAAVLAAAAARNAGDPRSQAVAVSALHWLWAQRLPSSEAGSYSAFVEVGDPARAGWCYGDPGVACAIAAASGGLPDPERSLWMERSRSLALSVARRPVAVCQIDDPTLCHGAFGLGHMLNRLGQLHRDPEILEAARTWIRRGLDMQTDRGVGGFVTVERSMQTGEFIEVSFGGLLDGAAGIALALAATVFPKEPVWDRAFVMSPPVP